MSDPVSAKPLAQGASPTSWATVWGHREGSASKVQDGATLERVARGYASVCGWRVTVREGAFHDTEGAPTAGPPPYDVYALSPAKALAFGIDEAMTFVPTRWRF